MKRLGFTIGITLVLSLIFLNIICSDLVTLILAITALLVFLLFLLFIKNKARAFVLVRTVSFTVLVASLLFYCTYTLTYKANSEVYGSSVNLEGVLYEQPLEYESGTFGYVIKPTNVNVKGKILVYSKEKLDADIYQDISLEVKISNLNKKPPLDESYNRAKGIYLTASYLSNFENKGLTNKLPLRYYFLKGKNFVVTTLNSVTNGSIATAIMTSDKTELSNEHKQLFKVAGVSHLMATSGFHLSLLASILFLLLSVFKLPKKIKIAVVMIVSVLFAAFIGFPPSITRALIMLLVFYFGTFFYVEVDSLNSLGIAATLICLLNPFSVLDIGFILSFMATIGILTVPDEFNIFTYRLKYKTKIIGKTLFSTIISTTITSLYAIIFTAPFIIFYFGSLPLYAILGNIVGVLFAPVIVILGIFAIIFAKIPFVFAFLSKALTFVIDGFLSILRAITSLPNANIYAGYTVVYIVLIALIVFLFLKKFSDLKIKLNILVAMIMALLASFFVIFVSNTLNFTKDYYVKFIDVGQGDAEIVSDGINIIAIDVGDVATAKKVSSEILKSGADFKSLMLSHFHVDHAGATTTIIDTVKPEKIIAPTSLEETKIINSIMTKCASNSIQYVSAIKDLEIKDIANTKLDYLVSHIKEEEKDENLRSAIVRLEHNKKVFLFMGDYDTNYSKLVDTYGPSLKADVLKVAHHGSRDTVSEKLISVIAPNFAVIHVGENNQYNLPNIDTLNRLQYIYKIPLYRTDKDGDITFSITDTDLKVKTSK